MMMKTAGISLILLVLGLQTPVWAETNVGTGAETNTPAITAGPEAELIGSWSLTLDHNNTSTPALFSFLQGGVLLQSENPMVDPMLGNLVFSNAHGSWAYNAVNNSYQIRYFKLVYQADAAFWGHEETTGTLNLDDDGLLSGDISVGNEAAKLSGTKITAGNGE